MLRTHRFVPHLLLASLAMVLAGPASAQSPSDPTTTQPATPTVSGDTGLWTVPTGNVLAARQWSFSLGRLEGNNGQGFLNISTFPLTVGVGVGSRTEVFGSWHAITRLDRDSRPLFFPAASDSGAGGGIDVDYPLNRTTFTGNKRGDLWLGAKVSLLPTTRNGALAIAIRPMVKLPAGDKTAGTSSGKADFSTDVIVSTEAARLVEISGYGGMLLRGSPAGFDLTNSLRWGAGVGLPSRLPLRATVELYGERFLDDTIRAGDLVATDGSIAPVTTPLTNPVYLNVGVTLQLRSGFFLGMGANWNLTMASRDAAGTAFNKHTFDAGDYLVRLGFHPGVRRRRAATSTLAPTAPAVTGSGAEIAVRSPDAPLVAAPAPQVAIATPPSAPVEARETPAIAAGAPVAASATRSYVFEDIHFDFDRHTLTADTGRVLDDIASAMRGDTALVLGIDGRTDDIGTSDYNTTLSMRRAGAVRDALTTRGIAATRITIVGRGETDPRHNNGREETRMMNRRVVLTLGAPDARR